MQKASSFFLVCVGLLGFALLPTTALAAWPHDPYAGNVALCTAANDQRNTTIISDGVGGAIVTWQDTRNGNNDIYAQRISAGGTPQWTANGVALCTATSEQQSPTIVADGVGGAIVTWHDYRSGNYDIYAQRSSAGGLVQWTANGVALCTATGSQFSPTLVSDGAGGAIVTWFDERSGGYPNDDIYAQAISSAGTVKWVANGVALCTAANEQTTPTIVSDGAGGAIVAWVDYRSTINYDIYAQRISAAGAAQWTANGVALCTATGSQGPSKIVSDGAGGAVVAWQDPRSGVNDIYAQRISAAGGVQWAANGTAICTAVSNQYDPAIVSDPAGGAIVTWYDYRNGNGDIYAQRISVGGAIQWTADGVALCTAAGDQWYPRTALDGAGGAVITWEDRRNGNPDVYAQTVNSAGATQWTANGVALCIAMGDQVSPTVVSDGAGGAIVTWQDYRNAATNYDIYAQRVERFGYLGPEPTIASVRDVPNDQGGKVKLSWYASWLDATFNENLAQYDIYRSAPGGLALGAQILAGFAERPTPNRPAYVLAAAGTQLYAWEYLATVPVTHFLSAYSYIAPTTGDSIGGSNPLTAFMVVGRSYSGTMFWLSAPDSGYSVDNIAPAAPAPFTGQYAGGTVTLHWAMNPATDLAEYRLYRGSTADFAPGPGNLVVAQSDTGYVDAAGAPCYYKLSAVDVHGNESGFSTLLPSGTADVPDGASVAFALAGVRPNPSHGERLSVAFTLPTAAPARLELLDVSGRRVLAREVGSLGAGPHAVDLGQGTRLAPGLYLVRLTQGANTRVARVAVLQ